MKSFQVLKREQKIDHNTVLEASAGTGKTFSIENIVVRLLIEKDAISLEQILVVTFTRAATRDLKARIHSNILKAITILKRGLNDDNRLTITDYLLSVIEKGENEIKVAVRKLESALFTFDLSQIYTIHSFSLRSLSDNAIAAKISLSSIQEGSVLTVHEIRSALRDYFRGGKLSESLTKGQIHLCLKKFSGNPEALEDEVLHIISKNTEIAELPSLGSELEAFKRSMRKLKDKYGFNSEQIVADFIKLAPQYKEVVGANGKYKFHYLEGVKKFSRLFDKENWDLEDFDVLVEEGLSIAKALDEANKKKNLKEIKGEVRVPLMGMIFKEHLSEHVNVNRILARLSSGFQRALLKRKETDESYTHDDYVLAMKNALTNPEFKTQIRARFQAIIIDEFQDTDPLQWEIFRELFLAEENPKLPVYIVGDPKQSIYSFRQADIYTYLKAKAAIAPDAHYSLNTNYRSTPPLVQALNTLFCKKTCPTLFPLPKENCYLDYPQVFSQDNSQEIDFSDDKGAIHFFLAEEPSGRFSLSKMEEFYFLPFIAQEIQKIVLKGSLSFNSFCILVSDRHQAARVSKFLMLAGIPVAMQRGEPLGKSPVVPAMKELLIAVQNPKDQSLLKIALGGKLIRWTQDEIRALDDPLQLELVLYKFHALREGFFKDGIHAFFNLLLKTFWKKDNISFLDRFLIEEDSEICLQETLQLAEVLFEQAAAHGSGFSTLIQCLDQMLSEKEIEEDALITLSDPSKNAVRMMTVFASKGLEFDIVFPIGLLKGRESAPSLFPAERASRNVLIPFVNRDQDEFQLYCQELDAEKMRQLYVAMTRAKYRLYIPAVLTNKKQTKAVGNASPMVLFLEKLESQSSIPEFLDLLKTQASISYSILKSQDPSSISKQMWNEEAKIVKPPQVTIPGNPQFLHSFTSLASSRCKKSGSHIMAPRDFKELNKTPHTLPSGTETGILLHKIMEGITFEHFQNIDSPLELQHIVHPLILRTNFATWEEVLCEILFHTLKVPLFNKFSLCEISSKKLIREGEFLYQSSNSNSSGYIKGFFDLVFEHEGKIYLLDWKSNWLGTGLESYTESNLHVSMEENDYFLQAEIYYEAVKKYWRLFDKKPFECIFGGIAYLYLRGLNSKSTGETGIYYIKGMKGNEGTCAHPIR